MSNRKTRRRQQAFARKHKVDLQKTIKQATRAAVAEKVLETNSALKKENDELRAEILKLQVTVADLKNRLDKTTTMKQAGFIQQVNASRIDQ